MYHPDTSGRWKTVEMINEHPKVRPVKLRKQYNFMYENFVVATQHEVLLVLEKYDDSPTSKEVHCRQYCRTKMKSRQVKTPVNGGRSK